MIVATHSSDVVQGAVDGSSSVAVLRLTRNAGLNRASLLPSADLNALWSKPQMRSAAAVDGLFSNGVVICEADSDARFYETLVQRFDTSGKVDRAPDLYFVAAGGKGGIATLASAYHRMGTPTAVIADLDLLRNEKELEAVLASVGGDIGSEVGPYRSLLSELRALPPTLKVDDFVAAVRRELSKIKAAGSLSSASKRELNNLVENAADWSSGKRNGITTIRGGARRGSRSVIALARRTEPRGDVADRGGAAARRVVEAAHACVRRRTADRRGRALRVRGAGVRLPCTEKRGDDGERRNESQSERARSKSE